MIWRNLASGTSPIVDLKWSSKFVNCSFISLIILRSIPFPKIFNLAADRSHPPLFSLDTNHLISIGSSPSIEDISCSLSP